MLKRYQNDKTTCQKEAEPSTEITKRYYYANKKNYQEEIDIDYRKISLSEDGPHGGNYFYKPII